MLLDPDGVLLVEDESVEVVAGPIPVRLGIGAVAYVHPGAVVIELRDGAIAYLAPGARIEDVDDDALSRAEVTVAQWQAYPALPRDVDVALIIPVQDVA